MARVSVIIPAWGDTPMLKRARESVLSQTYGDIELVVAAPFEGGPQTLPAARQAGLRQATGEWVTFCDADDWIEPNAVAEMLAAAEREQQREALMQIQEELRRQREEREQRAAEAQESQRQGNGDDQAPQE